MRIKSYFVAILLGLLGASSAAEVQDGQSRCSFRLTGEITAADVEAFASSGCGQFDGDWVVLFDSPGGDAEAAMAMGRWLRERNANVAVRADAFCHSSCALVYIGGVSRVNLGEIGLHRPYLAGAPRPADEVRTAVASMLADVRAYVGEMGVTPEFTNVMLNTPPAEMRVFHRDAIESLVPRNDPLYDELSTARFAKRFGLSTEEYRRRDAEAEKLCAPYDRGTSLEAAQKSLDCHDSTRWGLSVSVLQQRYTIAEERCGRSRGVSEAEWEAWEAAGHHWSDHPVVIDDELCIIAVMQGR